MERLLYFIFALAILYACSTDSFSGDIQIAEQHSNHIKKINDGVASLEVGLDNCSGVNHLSD